MSGKFTHGAFRTFILATVLTVGLFPVVPIHQAVAAQQLTVALYSYVPRFKQFKDALVAAWKNAEPNVTLTIVGKNNWDGGYGMDPDPSYDVYVFDAMYFEYFKSRGWLEAMKPGEVSAADDFIDYAKNGVIGNDGNYYALPLLGCANILFYDKSNAKLAAAKTLSDVAAVLGKTGYNSQIPPPRASYVHGLMIDLEGKTTNASLYLDIAHRINGTYPLPLPENQSQINQQAMSIQKQLLLMGSFWNATTAPPKDYGRAIWYSDGYGGAVVGFTESMSQMSAQTRKNLGFKIMPLSDDTSTRPLFFADVIGVNTSTNNRGTRDLAVKLANVLAAQDTVVKSIGPSDDNPVAQYLMASRHSVFKTLSANDPIYGEMYELVTTSNPLLFKVNSSARSWVNTIGPMIRQQTRADFPGKCDFPASRTIKDSRDSQNVCPQTCAANGGVWVSPYQWTNDPPMAQGGSVCGCSNACPISKSLKTVDHTPRPHY